MTHAPTLLVLSPSTGGYFFGELLAGVTREVAAVGGRVIVVQTLEPGVRSDVIGEPPHFPIPVAWSEVDGVVSVTAAVRAEYLEQLRSAGKPVVVASNRLKGLEVPLALPDNRGGTIAAIEHLIGHGHTAIGFMGNMAQQDIRDRYDAYLEALEANGLTADPDYFYALTDNSETGGHQAAASFAASTHRPTALMAATDRNAIGFLERVGLSGLSSPRDFALVGFDNIEASAYTQPPLTTVDQPFDQLGALAARLVLTQLDGVVVPAVAHAAPASVVVRGSCGCSVVRGAEPAADASGLLDPDHGESLRSATVERLGRLLRTGKGAVDEVTRARLHALLGDVARLTSTGSPNEVAELSSTLRHLAPRPGVLRKVAREVHEHVRRTAPPDVLNAFRDVLWHMEAAAFLGQSSNFELRLEEQFGVDAGLLEAKAADPELLGWLQGTHVSAGVLGLWSDGDPTGELHITGVYDPSALLTDAIPTSLRPESFPPAALVAAADPTVQDVCFVVPVRTREREWGLLAVTAEIETMSARETYHHWAALLAAALEEKALQAAVQASEERYSLAARAAKDGLWEWDAASGRVYVSERCGDLLGLDRGEVVDAAAFESLVHPDDLAVFTEAMSKAMTEIGTPVEVEYRAARFQAGPRWVLARCLAIGPDGGPVQRLVGSLSDIQTRKELEEKLRQAALYDAVTGLPNRRLFLDRLTAAVREPNRRRDSRYAVIFLDLDGFKLINDSLGHLVGDQLLSVVAERLRSELRAVDTAARFGGDEFALLLVDPIPDEVLVIAHRIQERIAAPVMLGGHEVSVTASVGIATSETGYTEAEDVVRDADTAMYHAKASERGSASVFDPEMHMRATGRLRARGELRTALTEHQFVVHYQPIVALDGAGVSAFEALVRWEHPERGLLLPGAFLPAMEDNATIVTLGQWIIEEVCRQIADWRSEFDGPVAVAVNLSHREFWSTALVSTIAQALAAHQVPPECLVLEITESVIMADPTAAKDLMTALHEMGIKLHVDDFGTGQSSLNALRTLPVDALKIDGSFIRELVTTERTRELVGVILYMGKVLGLDVIAECVETTEQAHRLQTMGCENVQGWLYAQALPGDDAALVLGTSLTSSFTDVPAAARR